MVTGLSDLRPPAAPVGVTCAEGCRSRRDVLVIGRSRLEVHHDVDGIGRIRMLHPDGSCLASGRAARKRASRSEMAPSSRARPKGRDVETAWMASNRCPCRAVTLDRCNDGRNTSDRSRCAPHRPPIPRDWRHSPKQSSVKKDASEDIGRPGARPGTTEHRRNRRRPQERPPRHVRSIERADSTAGEPRCRLAARGSNAAPRHRDRKQTTPPMRFRHRSATSAGVIVGVSVLPDRHLPLPGFRTLSAV